ncbi:protein of unknown function [Azospirillum lipoferum 4B]|uniref:Uncharacterized protein n=1 Tax=Azospirillum lipoferum (strain 4B) TaxID=862719 RepID=G7Z640_AZOL4|nr:protein of unknown function [Azospirillum lipoferum 4B]
MALLPLREKGWDEGCDQLKARGNHICAPHPNPSPARGEGLSSMPSCTSFRKCEICASRSAFAEMAESSFISAH